MRIIREIFTTERRKSTFASAVLISIALVMAWKYFNQVLPITEPIFQASIALVLGLILVERFFTSPTDVIANATSCLIFSLSLISDATYPRRMWEGLGIVCLIMLIGAVLGNLQLDTRIGRISGSMGKVINTSYRLSTAFGSARSLWSIALIGSLLPMVGNGDEILIFWYLMFMLGVLATPNLLKLISERLREVPVIPSGAVTRARSPNHIEVIFSREENVRVGETVRLVERCRLCQKKHEVSIYGKVINVSSSGHEDVNTHTGEVLILGALHDEEDCDGWMQGPLGLKQLLHLIPAGVQVFPVPNMATLPDPVRRLTERYEANEFLGHVIEGSSIGELRFQKLPHVNIERGDMVMVGNPEMVVGKQGNDNGAFVYYQVREVTTAKELETETIFEMQWVACNQIGALGKDCKFVTWESTPYVRSPVFRADTSISEDHPDRLGALPNTSIPVIVDSNSAIAYHTAVLGTTGSGKTTIVKSIITLFARHGKRLIVFDVHDDYDGKMLGINTLEIAFRQPKTEEAFGAYLDYLVDLDDANRQSIFQSEVEKEAIERVRSWHANGEFKSRWHVWYRDDQLMRQSKLDKQTKQVFGFFLGRWYLEEHIGKMFKVTPRVDGDLESSFLEVMSHWLENPDNKKANVVIIKMNMLGVPEQQEIAYQIAELVYRYGISCGHTELDVETGDPIARIGLILEEAQIFIPQSGQFKPGEDKVVRDKCRSALTNLARGGRKYGIGLVVVSQRSAYVSKGVLSQCNTLFALRTVNDNDKSVLLDFVDRSYLPTVTYLGNPPHRPEAILMGEASPSKTPVIIRYDLPLEFQNKDGETVIEPAGADTADEEDISVDKGSS